MCLRTATLLSALVFFPLGADAHSLKEVEQMLFKREKRVEITNYVAPDFTLRDADGAEVKLSDFRGKVVVLNFIFTNCPDVCPLHSDVVAEIQRGINITPMKDLVQFITITTDPERDTPDVMRAYGTNREFDPVNWRFLTSGPDAPAGTRELAQRYRLKFTPAADGTQIHGLVTNVIDREGRVRGRYHGLDFNPTSVILHVNALTNDGLLREHGH